MSASNLDELFLDMLKDTYDAEKQLAKALPRLAKASTAANLKEAFESHLAETEEQITRLEQIFEILEKPARGKKCVAMQGLIEEGKEVMEEEMPEAVTDAALIAAAQKCEHYEIAAYGTLATYAKILGMNEALKLLKLTIGEEKAADEKLSKIAQSINYEAQEEVEA
jgi:ferritin-like metal-binding protein YciE